MILVGSTDFGTERPTMTLPSGFQEGRFSKKELQFPGGTRLEHSQGITEVVGAFLPGPFHGFHSETTNPMVPRDRHACARAPESDVGGAAPGSGGRGPSGLCGGFRHRRHLKRRVFPGRTRFFCSAIPPSLLR